MIVANIKDAEKYYSVNPNFKAAFEFLKTLDKNSSGGYEFEGFKGGISEPETSDFDKEGNAKSTLEAHKNYLDIHYVIEGSEGIGYANTDTLTPKTEYCEDEDYILLTGRMNKIILEKGDFCIVFPEDAHAPAMMGSVTYLKKTVVKIRI